MLPPSTAPSPPSHAGSVSSRLDILSPVWGHPAEQWGPTSPHPAKTITLLVALPLTHGPSGSEPAVTHPLPKPAEQSCAEALAWGTGVPRIRVWISLNESPFDSCWGGWGGRRS